MDPYCHGNWSSTTLMVRPGCQYDTMSTVSWSSWLLWSPVLILSASYDHVTYNQLHIIIASHDLQCVITHPLVMHHYQYNTSIDIGTIICWYQFVSVRQQMPDANQYSLWHHLIAVNMADVANQQNTINERRFAELNFCSF